MIDTILKTVFVGAALVLVLGGWARAQDYEPGYDTTGHYETNAYGREYVPPTVLPNPYPGAYQPPVETILQNQAFTAQSYRCGGCY